MRSRDPVTDNEDNNRLSSGHESRPRGERLAAPQGQDAPPNWQDATQDSTATKSDEAAVLYGKE